MIAELQFGTLLEPSRYGFEFRLDQIAQPVAAVDLPEQGMLAFLHWSRTCLHGGFNADGSSQPDESPNKPGYPAQWTCALTPQQLTRVLQRYRLNISLVGRKTA